MFFHVFLFWPILIISCSKEFMDQCGWRRWAIDRNGSEVDLGDLRWGIDQLSAILYTISAIQYYGILCYRIQYQRSIQRCWCWSNCLFVFVLHVFVCLVGNEVDLRVAVCGGSEVGEHLSVHSQTPPVNFLPQFFFFNFLADFTCQFHATVIFCFCLVSFLADTTYQFKKKKPSCRHHLSISCHRFTPNTHTTWHSHI